MRPWIAFLLWISATFASAQSLGWSYLDGPRAADIGVGADGSVWMIGSDKFGPSNLGIYRLAKDFKWQKVPGGDSAVRIDVDPKGNPWVVTSDHQILRWNGASWDRIPGAANDIGIGADGSVWIVGNDKVGAKDFTIEHWVNNAWQKVPGGAVRVDVDDKGNPWVLSSAGGIFRWSNGSWINLPGGASDVAVGPAGAVFVVNSGGSVYSLAGATWAARDGALAAIALDGQGHLWGVTPGGQVFFATRK